MGVMSRWRDNVEETGLVAVGCSWLMPGDSLVGAAGEHRLEYGRRAIDGSSPIDDGRGFGALERRNAATWSVPHPGLGCADFFATLRMYYILNGRYITDLPA